MKITYTTAAAVLLSSTSVFAVGLDRSNQDITAIFEDGNYVELSYGSVMPSVGGGDIPAVAGFLGAPQSAYGDVAADYSQLAGTLTYQVNDLLSVALIFDQPYGADVTYPGSGAATLLGGTSAQLDSSAITALARYRLDDNFSVHGGVRYETIDASITLSGLAFGTSNGYNVVLQESSELGFVVGTAYEREEIALRVALTYFNSIQHDFDSVENGVFPGTTSVETPEAWNLDFQTGVAENTLLFGQIRHAKYGQTTVSPPAFVAGGGDSLTDFDNNTSYSIGVARRFSDAFAASVSVGYENTRNPLVSPLAPTNGNRSLSVGGQYTVGDVVIAGGVRYVDLGDAISAPGGNGIAAFTENDAVGVGLSVGYRF